MGKRVRDANCDLLGDIRAALNRPDEPGDFGHAGALRAFPLGHFALPKFNRPSSTENRLSANEFVTVQVTAAIAHRCTDFTERP
jgi:hypothetical protein